MKKTYVEIGKEAGLKHIYIGNIGQENPTYCSNCQEVLIRRHYFTVIENNIVDGACPYCGTKVEGVFDVH